MPRFGVQYFLVDALRLREIAPAVQRHGLSNLGVEDGGGFAWMHPRRT
jgi:hypothetical protein